jgi:hypothetical protein
MLEAILAITAAWLGATVLFIGVPMWRAFRREPLRRYALFLPRSSGALPLAGAEVWVEWWKAFRGVAGSGRGRVVELRDGAAVIDVDGRRLEFRPRRFGARAATGPAIVDGVEVSAVVVTSAHS